MATTFIDTARILVKSGAGGNGAVAFHREKYIAAGGPDGGDGGRGGDVILQVDDRMSTLMDFRYKRKYVAENGGNGAGKLCSGKNGAPLIIKVPGAPWSGTRRPRRSSRICPGTSPSSCAGGATGAGGTSTSPPPTRQTPSVRQGRPARQGADGAAGAEAPG